MAVDKMDSLQSQTVQAAAGLSLERVNSDRHGLKAVDTKPQGMIGLGWDIRDDHAACRTGRRMYTPEQIAIKKSMAESDGAPTDFYSQLPIQRKKQPDITEEVRKRLYGVPGQNIFTYDLEKPRACRIVPEHLDVGMIPKAEVKDDHKRPMFRNTLPQGSLDLSLMPKEGHTAKANTKKISHKTNESHIEPGYVTTEQPVKTTRLSPFKYATSLETGLLPAMEERSNARRHFGLMNAHCYDFLKGE